MSEEYAANEPEDRTLAGAAEWAQHQGNSTDIIESTIERGALQDLTNAEIAQQLSTEAERVGTARAPVVTEIESRGTQAEAAAEEQPPAEALELESSQAPKPPPSRRQEEQAAAPDPHPVRIGQRIGQFGGFFGSLAVVGPKDI